MQAGWKPGISKYAALLGILCCLFWVGITGSNYPALATVQGPEQIILTWTDDPASTQTVTWLSPDTTASQLQYMPAVDFNGDFPNASIIEAQMSPFGSSNYRYQAHITGLTADTSYVYRVGSAEAWSETLSFTTAADSDTFSFLYLGDVQEGYEEWEDLLDFIKQNHPQIKFSLLGGDLANNDNEWGQFLTAASPYFSQVPMMPTLGNHDGYMYLNFFSLPGNGPEGLKKEFYSFDYGNAHFVVLNSGNNTSPEAKEWLKTDLQNTSQTWKFAMFHYPAYPAFDDNKTIDESICENWVPILEANGVDMVFVGHQHQYMRTYPIYQGETQTGVESYGIVYIMGNSGSKHYGAGAGFPYIDCQETGSNYQLIEIEGEVLTLTSRKANGELIEVYTIDKRKYPPLLQSVSLNPVIGQSIDISFTDDPAWRGSISSIRVGGIELNSDQYTLSEGNIHISAQVFKQALKGIPRYSPFIQSLSKLNSVCRESQTSFKGPLRFREAFLTASFSSLRASVGSLMYLIAFFCHLDDCLKNSFMVSSLIFLIESLFLRKSHSMLVSTSYMGIIHQNPAGKSGCVTYLPVQIRIPHKYRKNPL